MCISIGLSLEQNEFSGAIVNTCGRILVKLKSWSARSCGLSDLKILYWDVWNFGTGTNGQM